MPKTILIMRHAKSSWATAGMDDHSRPLNKRGLRDAPVMGQMLVEQSLVPDMLLLSSSKRTKMTAQFLIEEFEGRRTIGGNSFAKKDAIATPDLYHATWKTHLRLMQGLSETTTSGQTEEPNSVMLLAHNPGIEALIEKLTGQQETMPTAAIAWIELAVEKWSDSNTAIDQGAFRLVEVWRPKSM